jgi:predicted ATP-grasp superfamily ATP-dependent carboligase
MDEKVSRGKGTDLVVSVRNKLTNETVQMDAGEDNEQFILTMAKAGADNVFMAKSCSPHLLVDHILNLAQDCKEEFMVALMIATTTGMIDYKEMVKRVKVLSVPIGDGGIPDFSNFGDDDEKKPTFN